MSARMATPMMVMMMAAGMRRAMPMVSAVVVVSTAVSVAGGMRHPRLFVVVVAGLGGDDEPGVDHARDPAEEGQDDVDEERAAAAFAEEDGEGREEDCYYCFAASDLGFSFSLDTLVGRVR